jgi:hypothetical protein
LTVRSRKGRTYRRSNSVAAPLQTMLRAGTRSHPPTINVKASIEVPFRSLSTSIERVTMTSWWRRIGGTTEMFAASDQGSQRRLGRVCHRPIVCGQPTFCEVTMTAKTRHNEHKYPSTAITPMAIKQGARWLALTNCLDRTVTSRSSAFRVIRARGANLTLTRQA